MHISAIAHMLSAVFAITPPTQHSTGNGYGIFLVILDHTGHPAIIVLVPYDNPINAIVQLFDLFGPLPLLVKALAVIYVREVVEVCNWNFNE